MQSFADINSTLLSQIDPDLGKAARAAQVQCAFAQAVLDAAGSEAAARYLLNHVQAVYVMRDDAPRRGTQKAAPILLRVYSDDSTVRAEIDARQEWIRMSLARQGIRYDRMRLHASTFGMKERATLDRFLDENDNQQPYDENDVERHHLDEIAMDEIAAHVNKSQVSRSLRRAMEATASEGVPGAHVSNAVCTHSSSAMDSKDRRIMVERLETLKRAFCLVFGSDADVVLAQINAAYLTPVQKRPLGQSYDPINATKRDNASSEHYESCHCILYSADGRMRTIIDAYGDQVRSEARRMGLYIRGAIRVSAAPEGIAGCQAFPPIGSPVIVDLPTPLAAEVLK